MHRYAVRLMKRNYARRFVTLAVVFAALVLLTAVLTPLLLRRQLTALDHAPEGEESGTAENAGSDTAGAENTVDTAAKDKKKDEEHRIKAALRSLPEVGIAAKIVLPLSAFAMLAVALLFRVTEAEWLWRAAVTHKFNRALWPILGACLGVLAVLALLVVANDPRRLEKQA